MNKASTVQQQNSPLSRLWHKWRFHINVLLVLIPLGFMPKYFADAALFRGDKGLGERKVGQIQVGPWSLELAENRIEAPRLTTNVGYLKNFNASLCAECIDKVKATYLRVGKPRSLRTAGVIFFGSGYRMSAQLIVPQDSAPDAELWITMEGWDGAVHQTSIPLERASPATVAWLKTQGAKK